MVVNDEINTIDNQPEVIQLLEVKKSHLISAEGNSTNSNGNLLEVIVPIGIVNPPSVPCSPGSIDSAKITTYHQPQITPQISCSSKDELTCNAKTASVLELHTCEDCLKKETEIVNLKKPIINLEFLYDSLSDLYERQNSDLFKDKEIKMLKVGFQLAIVEAIHTLNSPTPPRVPLLADTSALNIHDQILQFIKQVLVYFLRQNFLKGLKRLCKLIILTSFQPKIIYC